MRTLGGTKVPKLFCLLRLDEAAVMFVDDVDARASLAGGLINRAVAFVMAGDKGLAESIGRPLAKRKTSSKTSFLKRVAEVVRFYWPFALSKGKEPLSEAVGDSDEPFVNFPLCDLSRDSDGAVFEVDVLPVEPFHLSLADSTKEHGGHGGENGGRTVVEEVGAFLGSEDDCSLASHLGREGVGDGVGGDVAALAGKGKEVVKNAAIVEHGLRRETQGDEPLGDRLFGDGGNGVVGKVASETLGA